MPDTPTLCVGTPRCHGTPAWVPPIKSLQAAGTPRTDRAEDGGNEGHAAQHPWVPQPLSPLQPCPWSHRALAPPHHPTTGGNRRPLGRQGAAVGGTPGCARRPAPRTQHPGSASTSEVGTGETWGDTGDTGEVAHGSVCPLPYAELHQVHSTPVLTGGPCHVPVTGSRGEWETDFGLAAGWPQRRGHDGDTDTTVMAGGDRRRLPVFSSPKPQRGSASLASAVTGSPVTPPRPPHAWHPPVTR